MTTSIRFYRVTTYLLVKNYFLFFQDCEVVLQQFKLGLLLQTALHGTLTVLKQTTT